MEDSVSDITVAQAPSVTQQETTVESTNVEQVKDSPRRGRPPKKEIKLSKSNVDFYNFGVSNPWGPDSVDKMDKLDDKNYKKIVETCRFFYRHDALSSTIINKMVDIGINELTFSEQGLSDNEHRVFTSLESKLLEFAENMALEFLVSGLVIPEYKLAAVTKEQLKDLNIKKYPSLILPVSLWLRDPDTVTINKTFSSTEPSYFVEMDSDTLSFIRNSGTFPDGTKDPQLFEQLKANYPDFVLEVLSGQTKFIIENTNIIRRRYLSNSPYPIPYLYAAIESLKHKRNLKRMDYAVASRVISAILLVKLGSDTFPVTEDDTGQFDAIRNQMIWRNTAERDVERIFMLFGNHTLNLEWVFPDVKALLDGTKYSDVNQDILYALGFPRILITGENSGDSGSATAQYATVSPVKTMDNFRRKIQQVLQNIVSDIAKANNFKNAPTVSFKPLQLSEYKAFVDAIMSLYDRGNISRSSLSEFFGYDFKDELANRIEEERLVNASGIPEFAPTPNSRQPINKLKENTQPTQNNISNTQGN